MTYRQLILEKEPEKVDKKYPGGVYGCPRDRKVNLVRPGYCWDKPNIRNETDKKERNNLCRKCWGRQVKI